jgi:cyclophilin family peptidyl-prolyl cis-trans isomerase
MFGKKDLKEYDLSPEELEKLRYALVRPATGTIKVRLYPEKARSPVANFAHLAQSGFYDGLKFHRVIPGFMAQGGCPHSRDNPQLAGTGGPGWAIRCETDNGVPHKRGALSMAHAGKDTGGSQFFITFTETPHLDGVHTVFGGIEEGDSESFRVLDSIEMNDDIEAIEVVESTD